MATDFGIRLSPRLQHSPLWSLTPRAFRLWVFLAMKAQHAPFPRTLSDRQRLTVQSGQVLTSSRVLQREAAYRSPKALVADLAQLNEKRVIDVFPIIRERFRNGNASVSKTEAPERFRSGSAGFVVATLITVRGINQLREQGVSESETKRDKSALRVLSRDEREWQHAEAQLAAEGR